MNNENYPLKGRLNWPLKIRAPSSEFVSWSIPSCQISTAHAQPFRGARDLGFCLNVPLDLLLVWASTEGSGETALMRRLAWTIPARIGDKYQIGLTRCIWNGCLKIQIIKLPSKVLKGSHCSLEVRSWLLVSRRRLEPRFGHTYKSLLLADGQRPSTFAPSTSVACHSYDNWAMSSKNLSSWIWTR